MRKLLTTIYLRTRAELPGFFKNLRNLALYLAGSAIAVISVNAAMNLGMPPHILTICNYTIAACAAIASTSQLTKKD